VSDDPTAGRPPPPPPGRAAHAKTVVAQGGPPVAPPSPPLAREEEKAAFARTMVAQGVPVASPAPASEKRHVSQLLTQAAPDRPSTGVRTVEGSPPAAEDPEFQSGELGLVPGTLVNHFELIRELGRGGMGQVFLARDTRLGRLAALKFLGVQAPEMIERFLIEARTTAQCNHENIVVIYEAGEWAGQPYMALEYLEGAELTEELAGGPMTPARAVDLIAPVVRALVRAHELGIVHRDLKPDNIYVTRTGVVKVLDFGIAKLFESEETARRIAPEQAVLLRRTKGTQIGGVVGTMPYMSPEQWGVDEIDHRTDLWAVGIILWELLTGRHPLDPITTQRLIYAASALDDPMPPIAEARPDLSPELEKVVDRCLAKRKQHRFASASELLEALERASASRFGRRVSEDECPYPGMSAFQEADAHRFFGRSSDVSHMVQRLRENPLVGVVGPSGVGKSSFLRAGVVPALKASGEPWEVLITRPGRNPLQALATLLQLLVRSGATSAEARMAEHAELVARLRHEPGFFGTLLRARARQNHGHILLFVDQFEELYTNVDDLEDRRAYTACLGGVADDPETPLRVVVSMRSDFLDRAAEDRQFMDRLTRGLLFLPPIDREGMREALVHPLEMVGYAFESRSVVEDMLASLKGSAGALPLLQFTAAKLWDARDRQNRLLTTASYEALGGLAGALATHADEILSALTPKQQRLTRAIFQRLVTTDGTRALVDADELQGLSSEPGEIAALLDHLVAARLLVVNSRGEQEGPAVEIVHESLITSWPSLRRWREESAEDGAFLEQLRTAAKQWDAKGRPAGLVWRGEAMAEAQRFHGRFKGDLPERERAYLKAVVDLATRSVRLRRRLVVGAFVVLLGLVGAAAIALISIREAELSAREQKDLAEHEAERAREAEKRVTEQLEAVKRAEEAREKAAREATEAQEKAASGEAQLAMTYGQLEEALANAHREKARAEKAQKSAEDAAREVTAAKQRVERLLAEERARVKKLEDERRKLSTQLR
jgi:eukaryotic-like serine/threonine-protein kinase